MCRRGKRKKKAVDEEGLCGRKSRELGKHKGKRGKEEWLGE